MKILSTQPVFASKYFKVNHVEIERGGKKFEKDIIDENPIVVIIPYTKDGEIYMLTEYRDALEKSIIGIIGGKIIPGDDPLTAAKKELEEEAGLIASSWKHIATWETSPVMKKKMDVFFVTGLEKVEQQLEEDEDIKVMKFSLTEIWDRIENREIPVALDIAVVLLFERMWKEGKL